MAGWGGELDYPRFQTSITDGGHGNRLIGALKKLRQRLEPVHKRLSTVIIENLTWEKCIERYNKKGAIMYLDPPYPGNGCNYAHNMKSWEEHQRLVNCITNVDCKWILSSYDCEEVRRLFVGKEEIHFTPVQSYSGMKTEKNGKERVLNKEVLITNFHPDVSSKTMNLLF